MSRRQELPAWIRRRQAAREMESQPAVMQVAKEFDAAFREDKRCQARSLYSLGERIRDMLAAPDLYGADAVEQLAEFLRLEDHVEYLYLTAKVVSIFSVEFIVEQINAPTNAGNNLRFAHFVELAGVASDKVRLDLLEQARDELLSVEQLRELILEMRS